MDPPARDRRTFALPDADVWLDDGFLPSAQADEALARLLVEVPFRQGHVVVFGRRHAEPRLTCWLGDPGAAYTYSGVRRDPVPWTPAVQALKARVEAAVGATFDSVLVNLYRDGRDTVGWHADDEPELGPEPLIASVSLGAARTFRMKHRDGVVPPVSIELTHGALLVMAGPTQRHWLHALPRRARVTEPRVNLTFRRIGAGGERPR